MALSRQRLRVELRSREPTTGGMIKTSDLNETNARRGTAGVIDAGKTSLKPGLDSRSDGSMMAS
jgi:hypothetical protein